MQVVFVFVILSLVLLIILGFSKKTQNSNTEPSTVNIYSGLIAEIEIETEEGDIENVKLKNIDFKKGQDNWWYIRGTDIRTGESISTEGDRCDYLKINGTEYESIPSFLHHYNKKNDFEIGLNNKNAENIRFIYAKNENEVRLRNLIVQKIYSTNGQLYFSGVDAEINENRTFRYDRMSEIFDKTRGVKIDDINQYINLVRN